MIVTVAGVPIEYEKIEDWQVPRVYTIKEIKDKSVPIFKKIPHIKAVWVYGFYVHGVCRRDDVIKFLIDFDSSIYKNDWKDLANITAIFSDIFGKIAVPTELEFWDGDTRGILIYTKS